MFDTDSRSDRSTVGFCLGQIGRRLNNTFGFGHQAIEGAHIALSACYIGNEPKEMAVCQATLRQLVRELKRSKSADAKQIIAIVTEEWNRTGNPPLVA